jgi:DNA-binding MarR family transcriptional regulator
MPVDRVPRSSDQARVPRGGSASRPPAIVGYADPMRSIGYLLRMSFRAFDQALARRTIAHRISSSQWQFLRQLWREDGLTQRELSRRVGMSEASTATGVSNLVRARLARRTQSMNDRRKVHVRLTPTALELKAKLLPLAAEVNAIALQGFTPAEIEVLREALVRIQRNLALDRDGGPARDARD